VANGVADGEASGHKDRDNNRKDRLPFSIIRRTIFATVIISICLLLTHCMNILMRVLC